MNRKTGFWIALWLVLVVVIGYFAFFQFPFGMGYGPWQGWGRADGWGYAHPAYRARGWHGMPPEWMGGWQSGSDDEWEGPAYGMMGSCGEAMPGMGFGMPGWGYSMMPWSVPDLTPEQSRKIGELRNELAERNRTVMRQIGEAQVRLNSLCAAEKRDWNAIRSASRSLFDLRRQQSESAIDFQQKIDGLLTDAQRQEMARAWHGYGRMDRR